MKKMILSERYMISMYDYLVNYCQISEKMAIQFENMSHERICEFIPTTRISRFPMQYYIEEYSLLGIVLCVKDRSGKCLPYINPLLLQNNSKEVIMRRMINRKDIRSLLEDLLQKSVIHVVPVDKNPIGSHNTSKKSFQKIIDKKRRERNDLYDKH